MNPRTLTWPAPAERAAETKIVQWQLRNAHWAHRRPHENFVENMNTLTQPIEIVSDRILKYPYLQNINVYRVWVEAGALSLRVGRALELHLRKLPFDKRMELVIASRRPDPTEADAKLEQYMFLDFAGLVNGNPVFKQQAVDWVKARPRMKLSAPLTALLLG